MNNKKYMLKIISCIQNLSKKFMIALKNMKINNKAKN